MALYLVRHAKAGSRSAWEGDDELRPLSRSGQEQAEALAARLGPLRPPTLVSSPYLRCLQTLGPLADRTAVAVEPWVGLAEGAPFAGVLERLAQLPDASVMCSHGDVIPEVVAALLRRGAALHGEPNWKKGSVWVLERDDDTVVALTAWAPP